MGADWSSLSSPALGYDIVVSTSQASINSTLREWLATAQHPVSTLCFLDPGMGLPLTLISLQKLLGLTNGINPFDIPDKTPLNDPRVAALTAINFAGGFEIQVGMPPGTEATFKDLPVVTLGKSASNIQFYMYCSHFSIIENLKSGWVVSTQPQGTPWPIQTTAGLVSSDLHPALDTPYFQNAGAKYKTPVLKKLQLLTKAKDPFSLQQLLFDLGNASMITPVPAFLSAGSLASTMITMGFISTYAASVEGYGSPPLSIKALTPASAVRQAPAITQKMMGIFTLKSLPETDSTQVALTSINWEVSPPANNLHPTPTQLDATTLNYLCAVNGHQLPPPAPFPWDWVQEKDINSISGIIAINRNVLANHMLQEVLPLASECCIAASFSVTAHRQGWGSYFWTLTPNQQPTTVMIPNTGATVVTIAWAPNYDSQVESDWQVTAGLQILPSYTCNVTFVGQVITVTQHLAFRVYVRLDNIIPFSETVNVYDKTLTDEYTISVDQRGGLITTKTSLTPVDKSEDPHLSGIQKVFSNLDDLVNDIKSKITTFANSQMQSIPFENMQNFIFPGGRVFTFSSAVFSGGQDLLCAITYVDPSSTIPQPTPSNQPVVAPPFPLPPAPPSNNTTPQDNTQPTPSNQPVVAPPFPLPPAPPSNNTTPQNNTQPSNNTTPQNNTQPNSGGGNSVPSGNGTTSNGTSDGVANIGTYSLTYSSDLIQNYVQGEIVSPQAKFEALQTADGHSLLFSVSTSGVFTAIVEASGTSSTGWSSTDLSTAIIQADFAGAAVRTFDVGQSVLDGTIGLALAVSSGASGDTLLVSPSNSNSDTSWISRPNWVVCPFDAPNESRTAISIDGIFFSETFGDRQYLIVDIDRSSSAVKDITRYYVDPSKASGTCWVKHDVPVDIESGNYQSCVGRKLGAIVDGVYTIGLAGNSAQFVYQPILNAFGSGPPAPSRFSLPGNIAVTAIAAARNEDKTSQAHATTDVYAAGGSSLYCLAASAQNDGATGVAVLNNPLLVGTSQLIVMTHDGTTTLWGRNQSDVVYYTSCATASVLVPGSWSLPIPVLSAIENISAFVNRSDGGNTIFAAGGGQLQRLVQATSTKAKIWQTQAITLAAQPTQPSVSFKSYTTSLQLQALDKTSASGLVVTLSAQSRAPVYINGTYYTLGPAPINVPADSNGMLIIAEAITTVNGSIINVSIGNGAPVSINPMDKQFKKLASLNSVSALQNATITVDTKAGGTLGPVKTKPLLSQTASQDDIATAASDLSNLNTAYNSLHTSKIPAAAISRMSLGPTAMHPVLRSFASIEVGAGDWYQMAASKAHSAFDAAESFLHDPATDAWTYVTKYGGQLIHVVLDTVDAVVGAINMVLNKILDAINDAILFLELLFEWDDITRTKNVICSVVKLYLHDAVSGLAGVQPIIDGQIASLENSINSWSGIKNWPTFGTNGATPLHSGSSNSGPALTPSGHMFMGHVTDNAGSSSTAGDIAMDLAHDIFEDLAAAIAQEGQVLQAMGDQFRTLGQEISTMSADQVIIRIIGIIADGFFSSAQVVIDCLLKVLVQLSGAVETFFELTLHIPVISDILNALGVGDFSILDVLGWVGAVPATLAYKLMHGGSAPFPDNTIPNKIAIAKDLNSLITTTPQSPSVTSTASFTANTSRFTTTPMVRDVAPQDTGVKNDPDDLAAYEAMHLIASFYQLARTVVQPIEATDSSPSTAVSRVALYLTINAAVTNFMGNFIALTEPENIGIKASAATFTGISILSGILLSDTAVDQYYKKNPGNRPKSLKDPRAVSAAVGALLSIPSFVCSCLHLKEMTDAPAGNDWRPARLDESANMFGYLGKWMYCVIVQQTPPPSPEVKEIAVVVMTVANFAISALYLTEAAFKEF